ncbi:hypothetical protein Q3G72_010506 [Acer saccharum]|nr:hypothetical protein Q3G72_010506 [Acer saccharum]
MKASNLIQYFDQGNNLDGLSDTELKTLIWFIDEKRKEIKRWIAYYEHTHVSHSSFLLALPLPLIAPISDQDSMLVLDQMAHTNRDNTIRFDDNHHGKALLEFTGQGILQNDMTIAHLSLHFDANNNEVIFLKNGETGDNVSDGNLGLSSEFSGGNSATGDVVLLYNVTKQWHTDLCP